MPPLPLFHLHPSVKPYLHSDGLRRIEQRIHWPAVVLRLAQCPVPIPNAQCPMHISGRKHSAIHKFCSKAHATLLVASLIQPEALTSSQFCPSPCIFISVASYAMVFTSAHKAFLGGQMLWKACGILILSSAHPKLGGNAFQIPTPGSLVGQFSR